MHRNSNDNIVLCTIEIVVAAPDADYFKSGFPESTDHLLPGDSRELHFRHCLCSEARISQPGWFAEFLATSIYPGSPQSVPVPLPESPSLIPMAPLRCILRPHFALNRIANTGIRQTILRRRIILSLYKGFRKLSMNAGSREPQGHEVSSPGHPVSAQGHLSEGPRSHTTRERIRSRSPASVTTSTGRPSRAERSIASPPTSRRLRPGSSSIRKSMSLSDPASPWATDPKTRMFFPPAALQERGSHRAAEREVYGYRHLGSYPLTTRP